MDDIHRPSSRRLRNAHVSSMHIAFRSRISPPISRPRGGPDCYLSFRNVPRMSVPALLFLQAGSEPRCAVGVPRHAAGSNISHTHHSDSHPHVSRTPCTRTHSTPPLCLWSIPEHTTLRAGRGWASHLAQWLDQPCLLRFSSLLDDDDVSSPPAPLSAAPTLTRLLSVPIPPRGPFIFPTPPLSPLPPTLMPTQDLFTHTATTLFLALTTVQGHPPLIIPRASSWPVYHRLHVNLCCMP